MNGRGKIAIVSCVVILNRNTTPNVGFGQSPAVVLEAGIENVALVRKIKLFWRGNINMDARGKMNFEFFFCCNSEHDSH